MKVSLISDLHLEFCDLILPGGDILLLAGDITVADYLSKWFGINAPTHVITQRSLRFFKEECAKYRQVYYIAGNHEHYRGVFEDTINILRENLEKLNIKVLDNETVDLIPGSKLFAGTLWTNYHNENPVYMNHAQLSMNDHYLIKHDFTLLGKPAKFIPYDAFREHKKTLTNLNSALEKFPNDKFLVMTHHAPSYQSVHAKYKDDMLNFAYASDLSQLIIDNPRIKHWVHGHTHTSFNYKVGDCQVLCNPRGYTRNMADTPEDPEFDVNFSFEVE